MGGNDSTGSKPVAKELAPRRKAALAAVDDLLAGRASQVQVEDVRALCRLLSVGVPGLRDLGYLARLTEDLLSLLGTDPALAPLVARNVQHLEKLLDEAPADPAVPARNAVPLAPGMDGAASVLVVDADPARLAATTQALQTQGFRVLGCGSAAEVQHAVERERPDLLVLERRLPDGDALAVCWHMRGRKVSRYMPIIVLGSGPVDDRVSAFEAGADDFLPRPFADEELAARVKAHLSRVTAMREMALRDPLTRAYNRGYFDERLRQETRRSGRTGYKFTLAMLDIDHFKRINDTFGHQAGDTVLAHVAQILQAAVRSSDMIARYGGEEFAWILVDADLEHATEAVRRTCVKVANSPCELKLPDGKVSQVRLTMSAGVASLKAGERHEALLGRADQALYAAKNAGRNLVCTESVLEPEPASH